MVALPFAHGRMRSSALQCRMTATPHFDEIDIVDAQLHLSLTPDMQTLAAQMRALGIRAVLLDELWGRNEKDHGTPCTEFEGGAYRPLSPLALAASLQKPCTFAFVQRIVRRDPAVMAWVDVLATTPGCRGLRMVLWEREDHRAFVEGTCDPLLARIEARRLPLCVLARDGGGTLLGAARRFPGLSFVLDHCGWVRSFEEWRSVLALAACPNVHLKWSHAWRAFVRPVGTDGGAAALQSAFVDAVSAFGAERVLWASDVTHDESAASWQELLDFVHHNPALGALDKAWVLGRSARRVFDWPPVAA